MKRALGCAPTTLFGQAEDHARIVPLRCKRWSCPTCGSINRNRLRRRLHQTPVTHLITLTCRPSHYKHPHAAFRALSAAVPNLVKRIHRAIPGAPFHYLLVWESTRRGWPHAHILARTSYIPQKLLSHHWLALTGSPVVDIRHTRTRNGPAAYLAKYLTKSLTAPHGLKRFRTSRAFWPTPGGIFPRRPPTGHTWHRIPYPPATIAALYPYPLYFTTKDGPDAYTITPAHWRALIAPPFQ